MYVEYYTDTDATCNEVILIFETTRSNKQYKFSFQGNILVSLSFNFLCAYAHTAIQYTPTNCLCSIFYTMRICAQPTLHTHQPIVFVPYFIPCARTYAHSHTSPSLFHILFHAHMRTTNPPYTPTNCLCSIFYSMRICAQPS